MVCLCQLSFLIVHSTCLIYKCQNNLAPQYLVEHFNNKSESHDYNTRSSTRGDITLSNPSNNQLMRTFKYNGAKLWNALDISVRGKPSLKAVPIKKVWGGVDWKAFLTSLTCRF